MTESEWLACNDPKIMLDELEGKASERKLRLFVCGCIRVLNVCLDNNCRHIIEAAEQFADGKILANDLSKISDMASRAEKSRSETQRLIALVILPQATSLEKLYHPATYRAAYFSRNALGAIYYDSQQTKIEGKRAVEAWENLNLQAMKQQAAFLRCIFGNPFRPITLDPTWLSPKVKALAQTIYDERTFDQMPNLADALEQAGCGNAEILAHSHGPGLHVRGCWAVDLVLGKG